MIDLVRPRSVMLDAVFAVNQRLRFPVDVAHGFRIARSAHLRGRDWYDCTWRQIRPEWRIRGKGGPADQQQYDRDKTGLPAAPRAQSSPSPRVMRRLVAQGATLAPSDAVGRRVFLGLVRKATTERRACL